MLSAEPPEYFSKNRMRAGLFFSDTRRFLPLGLPDNQAFAMLINTEYQQILNVKADATPDLFSQLLNISWQVQPWLLNSEGETIVNRFIEKGSVFYAIDFWFNGLEILMNGVEEVEQFMSYPANNGKQPTLRLLGEGSLIASTPSVKQVRMTENNVLVLKERSIQLGSGHDESQQQSFLTLGNNVFITSNHYGCNYDDVQGLAVPYQHHVLDYIDMTTGEVSRLSEGNGVASIQVFEEKYLALQRGEQLDVLVFGNPSNIEILPKGLMLHAPLRKKNCVYH